MLKVHVSFFPAIGCWVWKTRYWVSDLLMLNLADLSMYCLCLITSHNLETFHANDCHSFNDLAIHLLTRCIWLSIIFNLQVFAAAPCPALPPGSALPFRCPTTCRRFARYKMCMWLSAIVPFVSEFMWLSAIVPFYLLQVLETSPCRGCAAEI